MKKKFIATALVGLAAITALAGCNTNDAPDAGDKDPGIVAPVAHTVKLGTVGTGAHAYLSCATATKDTKVTVTVVLTDADNYELGDVKAGDAKLTRNLTDTDPKVATFDYLMGEEDVTFTVATTKIVVPEKAHKISVNGLDGVVIAGLPQRADAGEEIEFSVGPRDGFHIKSVKVFNGEEEILTTGDVNTSIKFAMPDADVTIEIEVEGNLQKLSQVDEEGAEKKVSELVKEYYDAKDGVYASSLPALYFNAGTKVRFLANHVGAVSEPEFFVNNTKVQKVAEENKAEADANKNLYEFNMPAGDATLKAVYTHRAIELELNAPEGVTIETYYNDPDTKEKVTTNKIPVGQKACFSFSYTNPNILLDSMSGEYDVYASENVNTTEKVEMNYDFEKQSGSLYEIDNSNDLYFTVSSSKLYAANKIVLNFTTFAHDPLFVMAGQYRGFDTYEGSNGAMFAHNGYKATISEGEMNITSTGGYNGAIKTGSLAANGFVVTNTEDNKENTAEIIDNFIFIHTEDATSPKYYTTMHVLVKNYNTSLTAEPFFVKDKTAIVLPVRTDDWNEALKCVCYIDIAAKKIYTNLSYDDYNGRYAMRASDKFTLKDGDTVIYENIPA